MISVSKHPHACKPTSADFYCTWQNLFTIESARDHIVFGLHFDLEEIWTLQNERWNRSLCSIQAKLRVRRFNSLLWFIPLTIRADTRTFAVIYVTMIFRFRRIWTRPDVVKHIPLKRLWQQGAFNTIHFPFQSNLYKGESIRPRNSFEAKKDYKSMVLLFNSKYCALSSKLALVWEIQSRAARWMQASPYTLAGRSLKMINGCPKQENQIDDCNVWRDCTKKMHAGTCRVITPPPPPHPI